MAEIYWPYSPEVITEGFGWSDWRQGIHDGIDFGVPQGTEIKATAAGVIRNNDAGQRDGAGVDITTPDGWVVRHWHLSAFVLPPGTQVNAGDVIALSGGKPGTWGAGNSTGPHIHWGVKIGQRWVDPAELNPKNFDDPKPQPKRKKNKMGAFYRSPGGSIVWQEKPNTKVIGIDFTTWQGYAANGNSFAQLTQAEYDALIKKYG